MSLKRLDRIRRSIGFRLIAWYSSIFVLSALLLFTLIYLSLSSSLHQRIREDVRSKLREYAAQYRAGGMETLRKEVALEKKSGKDAALFVRVMGPDGETVFLDDPEQWTNIDVDLLERTSTAAAHGFVRLQTRDGYDTLDIESAALDGNLVLQVGKSTEEEESLLEQFRETFVGLLLPVLILGIAGGAFLAHRSLRPLRSLVSTIRSISPNRLDARVPATQTGDELDELVTLFNAMLEKIGALIKGMRGSLDNVAHDLRTPMTRLRGTAEIALQYESNAGVYRDALADCVEESDRILTMLNTLMDISEAETGAMKLNFEAVDISV